MPGPGSRQKAPRGWARLMERKRNKTKRNKTKGSKEAVIKGALHEQMAKDAKPQPDLSEPGPWRGSEGGRVETEDQRSKRMEKEDANVRGYMHGGKVKKK